MHNPDLLKTVDIFAQLSEPELRGVAALLEEKVVSSGETIFRQGEPGDALYLVLTGQVQAVLGGDAGGERVVAIHSRGHCFGEMGLLIGETSGFTARAAGEARLLVLSKEAFDGHLAQNVPLMLRMMKVIAQKKSEARQQISAAEVRAGVVSSPAQPAILEVTSLLPVAKTEDVETAPGPAVEEPPLAASPASRSEMPPVAPPLSSVEVPTAPPLSQPEAPRAVPPSHLETPPTITAPTFVLERPPADEPSSDVPSEAEDRHRGRVITVFSSKGGAGKTTVAVNLAVALARARLGPVALLDVSLSFGHVPLLLNLTPKSSLAAANPEALKQIGLPENMEHYLSEHRSSHLRVMAGALQPEEGETVSAEMVQLAVAQLRRHFSYLVLDTGSNFSDPVLAALEASDRLVLLCSPELTVLRDARDCQRIMGNVVGIPRDKILYVMNYLFPFRTLSREQFEDALQQKLFAELPYGGDAVTKAALKGEAVVETQPGSPFARGIQKLMNQLTAERTRVEGQQDRRRGFFR